MLNFLIIQKNKSIVQSVSEISTLLQRDIEEDEQIVKSYHYIITLLQCLIQLLALKSKIVSKKQL